VEEILQTLGRVEGILGEQREDIKEIKVETKNLSQILIKNTQILDEHQRRSTAIEKTAQIAEQMIDLRLKPIEQKYQMVLAIGQIVGFLSAGGAAIFGIVRGFQYLKLLP
jgi:hypothetical protein